MANETGNIGMEDIGWGVREDVNKVTEEAVRRVQDNQKKAQQIGQQIKKDKDINERFAQFLTFLLKKVNNEKLIKTLYDVFFKTKHPKTQLIYLRKNINTIVIVGMFAPFYQEEIERLQLHAFFSTIPHFSYTPSITSYIDYLKSLSQAHHDNIPMDKEALIDFICEVLIEYHLVSNTQMNHQERQELREWLTQTLYGK